MPINKVKGSKDGKQKYRVRVNYTDMNGNHKQIERTEYGLAEARELERILLAEVKQAPSRKLTVKALYDEYVKTRQYEVRASTLDRTKTILQHHVLPYVGEYRLDKLTIPVLQKWKTEIETKTYSKGGKTQNLQIQTKQNAYSAFRTLLNFSVKMGYLTQNPLIKVGNFKDSNAMKKEMQYYTAEEFEKFIQAARKFAENSATEIEWDYYVFFAIAFYTGLRKGEIHALKWTDIDGKYLSVSRSINQKLKGGDVETPPKNKSSIRTLQMPDPLIQILNEHKARYKKIKGFHDDWRITGGTGPLRDTSIEKANKKIAAAAGVKKIRIHDFRHSHVSLLANNGINIQEIARRLGHANIEMTWNTYSHLYPREEERATEILNQVHAK